MKSVWCEVWFLQVRRERTTTEYDTVVTVAAMSADKGTRERISSHLSFLTFTLSLSLSLSLFDSP